MTRLEVFAALFDRDGLVSAGTLSQACGCSMDRATWWLSHQAKCDRIVRVAPGLYQAVRDGRPSRPRSVKWHRANRRSRAKMRARLIAGGLCLDCRGVVGDGCVRCASCREKRAAKARGKRAEVARAAE